MATLSVPIDSEIVGELFLRKGPTTDVASWIERIVKDYLERTRDDGNWSDPYYEYRDGQVDVESFRAEFGDPQGGYHWAPVFLPNGTQLRMDYKRQTFNATVKFDKVEYQGQSYTPSELARAIASGSKGTGTSRNAWRDLLVKRPGDTDWIMADDLRRRLSK